MSNSSGFGGGSGFGKGGGAPGSGPSFTKMGPINQVPAQALPGMFGNSSGGAAPSGGVIAQFVATFGMKTDAASFVKAGLALMGIHAGLLGIARAARDALTAIPQMVNEVSGMGLEAQRLAGRAGVSTDFIQELGYIGSKTGLTMDFMATRLAFLSRNMVRAKEGVKESSAAFKDLGVKVVDPTGKLRNVEGVVDDLVEGFAKLKSDDPRRAAYALTLVGRGGANFLDVLGKTPAAFRALREEAHRMGYVLSSQVIKDSVKFTSTMRDMDASMRGLKVAIVGPLINSFTRVVRATVEWVLANRAFIALALHRTLGLIATTLKRVWAYITMFWVALKTTAGVVVDLLRWLWNLSHTLGALSSIVAVVALAWFAYWALAASPVALLVGLLTFIVLLIDDIIVGLQGGESVIFELFEQWGEFLDKWSQEVNPQDNWVVKVLKWILNDLLHIEEVWNRFLSSLRTARFAIEDFFIGSDVNSGGGLWDAFKPFRDDYQRKYGHHFNEGVGVGPNPAMTGPAGAYSNARGVFTDEIGAGSVVHIGEVHVHSKTDNPQAFANAFTEGVLRATQEAVRK